jgi:biopolymer transport protein ExbD
MALKPNGGHDEIMAEINMTPLIDIMLVLLIIFMVTSSVSLDSGLDIDLPDSISKTKGKKENAILVSLNNKGEIFVQGQLTDEASLKEVIKKTLTLEKTKMVVFEGDKSANLGRTIEIMDIAKAAGADKFAIAAETTN